MYLCCRKCKCERNINDTEFYLERGRCEVCPACEYPFCNMTCLDSDKKCIFCLMYYCYGDCDDGKALKLSDVVDIFDEDTKGE